MDPSKKENHLTRRKFIDLSLLGSASMSLSNALPASLLAATACSKEAIKTAHGACYHDCPDTCSWTVTAKDNKVIDFVASKDNPYTAGRLCGKMNNFPNEVTFHPDRILTPLKRVGKKGSGQFEPISWEQGIKEVALKLEAIIQEKGGEAVLPYSFAGTEGLVQKESISARFFAHIKATRLDRTICGNAAVAGVMATNGQTTGVLPEDIIHSRYIIFWGTNPVISNQHLWQFIPELRKKGVKIIVVDPFQSQTALEADWHIQPKPGTDVVLALAMIHVILAENLQDQDYIDQYTTGIEQLTEHVGQYPPEVAAKITGLDPQTIIDLSREYAEASPSLIRILIGMEHQSNGANAFRAVAMLPALTGAWRNLGGGLMHMTYEAFGQALNWERLNIAQTIEDPDSRLVNMIQIGRALNDPDMKPGIQAMFVYNSNPAVIAPNQNLVLKGLEREDLMTVVLEHFMTDTARYADYIFPATSQLEHWDLLTSWGQAYLNLNQPIIPPLGQTKPNTEFFRLLAKEMGFEEEYLYESDLSIIEKTLDSDHPYMEGITFESLKESGWAKLKLPEPWLPHKEGNFSTASGKCQFYNPAMDTPLATYRPVAYSEEEITAYPLQLLTVKSTKNFLNSSHANVDRLIKKEGPPLLDINPTDANARGIKNGEEVKVYNQKGEMMIKVRVSEKVKTGIVCMPQGFWTSLIKGRSSANALTNDALTDMGNGGAFQDTRVEIVKV